MNRILPIGALLLAGLALAVSVTRSSGESPAPVDEATSPTADTSREVDELRQRVRSLEETQQTLARRLLAVEAGRPVGGPSDGGGGVTPAELESVRSEVRGLIAGEALNSEGGRTYLKDMMRSMQREMRTEGQQRAFEAMRNEDPVKRRAEQAERWKTFSRELGLNSQTESALLRLMDQEDERRQALFNQQPGPDGLYPSIRPQLRQLREETDKQAFELLTADQQARYREERREERRGPRGGGFGNRPE